MDVPKNYDHREVENEEQACAFFRRRDRKNTGGCPRGSQASLAEPLLTLFANVQISIAKFRQLLRIRSVPISSNYYVSYPYLSVLRTMRYSKSVRSELRDPRPGRLGPASGIQRR